MPSVGAPGRWFARVTRVSVRRAIVCRTNCGAATLAIAASCVMGAACNKSVPAQPDLTVDMPPVPAPANLVADMFVPTPEPTYQKLRSFGGPAAGLLPKSFAMFAANALGLPSTIIEYVDGTTPVIGATIDIAHDYHTVLGLHLRNSRQVLILLSGLPDSPFVATQDPSGVVFLTPRNEAALNYSFGIAGQYLVLSDVSEGLRSAGAYVARTVCKHEIPKSEIGMIFERGALKSSVSARLQIAWDRYKEDQERQQAELKKQHGGRAPDFGDPAALLGDVDGRIKHLSELIADFDRAELAITFSDAGMTAKFDLTPSPSGVVAKAEIDAMVIGAAQPLLELPAGSMFAVLLRDNAEQRQAGAKGQIESLRKMIGNRITEQDRDKLSDAFVNWAQGRGDWISVSLAGAPGARAMIANGAVGAVDALHKAVREGSELLGLPALSEPFARYWGELHPGKVQDVGGYKLVRLRVPGPKSKANLVAASGPSASPDPLEMGWRVVGGKMQVAIASDVKSWFVPGASKGAWTPLSQDNEISAMAGALGADAAGVVLLQPLQIVAFFSSRDMAAAPSSPVMLSYGRTNGHAWIRGDLSKAALAALASIMARPGAK